MSVNQKNKLKEEELNETVENETDSETNGAESVEAETTEDVQNENQEDVDQLIEDQQKRINELEEELERVKDTQLRKAAEMDNMRKRLQRERELIFKTAREAAIEEFLPVSDDLVRTLKALENSDADPSYLDGIRLVANKFDEVLKKHEVERIDQTGVPFDVNIHDAMLSQKPDDESIESGTVLQIVENGYTMGDKTLRHAKVIVSE
jgi:molecular chaperone GrpE